jgi:hypothetical protein
MTRSNARPLMMLKAFPTQNVTLATLLLLLLLLLLAGATSLSASPTAA